MTPSLFLPARYLAHINEGKDHFRIRIDIVHKILGKMFVQAGVFHESKTE